tara:strand:- start:855 stop:1781 length:927 start_codon:yes stop_codon:yes gene_type:complete
MDKKLYYLVAIFIFVIITSLLGFYYKQKDADFDENIESFTNYDVKEDFTNIYDKFYSGVYDTLFESNIKNEFEWYNVKSYTLTKNNFSKNDIKILDLGCGTGGHLALYRRDKYRAVGIDKSYKMLQKAKKISNNAVLIKGDFHNKSTFKNREFSHVTCFFYTIYYSNRVAKIFKNVNHWLKPKGFFCVHLIDKKKFDPVLERASKLIPLYNPQKHSKERVTKTKLKFDKFNYLADWSFDKDNVIFTENFMFNDDSTHRQNVHKFKIKPIQYYVKLAKKNGFELIKIIDLFPANHENNYIYIFQKKYGL